MKNSSSIVITDTNAFRSVIQELEETIPHISDIFENQNKEMIRIDHTEIWLGKAQEKVTEKYNELKNCYNPVKESLNLYVEFLKNTVEQYEKLEQNINQDIESNINNLNVN